MTKRMAQKDTQRTARLFSLCFFLRTSFCLARHRLTLDLLDTPGRFILSLKIAHATNSMSSKIVVMGLAAGAAAMAAGILYILTRPAPVKSSSSKTSTNDETPSLDKQTMIKIFERITGMMQVVVMNLAEHEQQVRQAAAQRGKQVTNQEMEQYLMGQFRQAMGEVEQTVYKDNNTSEEQVRVATLYYADDEDFAKTLNKLKALFKAMTGQPNTDAVEVPEHVTMEKVLIVMSETMEGINDVLEKLHAELKEQGLSPESTEFKQQLQTLYLERVQLVRNEVHAKHNVSEVS